MRIVKHLKKNNGSTLTLVLFMLFLLSVTAIAVITLTASELSMSVMTSDRSKALLIAQSGAEKAAQVIDEAVAQAQENARVAASSIVQEKINAFRDDNRDGIYEDEPVPITEPFIGVIDNSDINEIKILDEKVLNEIYEAEYKFQFNQRINELLSAQTVIVNSNTINMGDSTDGKYTYGEVNLKSNATVISPVESSGTNVAITSIEFTSTGEYKSPSNGSTYKRRIKAEFGLLTKSENGKTEIPISYGKLTKIRVNKDVKPSILSNKALIAQKNIISVDSKVNVNGNVISYGYIPTVDTATGKKIDYDAEGYKFGGIMAGMTSLNNTNDLINKVWKDTNLGAEIKAALTANSNALEISDIDHYFTTNHAGSFDITGNVGTLAYVHSLYSRFGNSSSIKVDGNTYARSVKVESESCNSITNLKKNVITIDDLRIDGINSIVKIGGWDDNIPPVTAGSRGNLVGLNTGTDTSKVSSAVIVAGDSNLYINGSLYVGGSTFYGDYNSDSGSYISGMSVQKSDNRPIAAFEIDGNILNERNAFYFYNNNSNSYKYITDPTDPTDPIVSTDPATPDGVKKLITKEYNKIGSTTTKHEMMEGCVGVGTEDTRNAFYIVDRAMHFKYIWDYFWKDKTEYAAAFNTGDIVIEPAPDSPTEKLEGFCWGGVAANNTIYDPYNGFTEDGVAYYTKANNGKEDYADIMDLFIEDSNQLALATPTKNLSDSVNKLSTLEANKFYPEAANPNNFMYYGSGNVVLTNESVGDGINKNNFSNSKGSGIVYSVGDIYVKAGMQFKGILIAEGNIVFLGGADIVYNEDVIDNLLNDEQLVGRFFKHTTYDFIMNDEHAIVQTIKKKDVKNIKIISWKEI